MIPRFSLARPRSLDEAFEAFAAADGEGAYIAGGTELLQVMKMGFGQFETLIDLKAIAQLQGIEVTEGSLRIGATTTHRSIERSAEVLGAFPGLVDLERHVANVRVRSTGTLGGNLAFAEPHSDPATLLLACDARVELCGPAGDRSMLLSEFLIGPLATARAPEEIVAGVRIPAARSGEGRAYGKLAFFERPAASVAVRLSVRDGVIEEATVAVGSFTEVPVIVEPAGAALVGAAAEPATLDRALSAAAAAFGGLDAIEDLNGSADYKRHLAGVLLQSTGRSAVREATAHA